MREVDGQQLANRIGIVLPHRMELNVQHAIEMQASKDAHTARLTAAILPTEAVDHGGKTMMLGQIDEIADPHHRILYMRGDDLQIFLVFGQQSQPAHCFNRSISAPRALSFSSMRSKPRSR